MASTYNHKVVYVIYNDRVLQIVCGHTDFKMYLSVSKIFSFNCILKARYSHCHKYIKLNLYTRKEIFCIIIVHWKYVNIGK